MKKNLLMVFGFGALIFIGITGFLVFQETSLKNKGEIVPAKAAEAQGLVLTSFRQLRGTQYFISQIVTDYNPNYLDFGERWFEFESNERAGSIRNLVFLDGKSLVSHKLLEDNQAHILNMLSYPVQPSTSNSPDKESVVEVPIKWFVYVVVYQDTNQDGNFNRDDLHVLGISDVSGYRYVEMLTGLEEIYMVTMFGDGELLVAYRQNGERFAAKISLDQQVIIGTEKMPGLGDDVK